MNALRCALALLFVLAPAPALARGAPAAASARGTPASLSGTAAEYFKSLLAVDLKGCLKQTISQLELQALLGRSVDKKEHETALHDFIDKRMGELKEQGEAGDLGLKRVEIIDVIILAPETSKLKRVTAMAVVRPILETAQGELGGFPHYLLQVGAGWKLSLKP